MKKFNLFKEIIIADKGELLEAANSDKIFGIRVDGSICYEPFDAHDALIFSGIAQTKNSLEEAFGRNYQVVEDEERVLIKALRSSGSTNQERPTMTQPPMAWMSLLPKRWKP